MNETQKQKAKQLVEILDQKFDECILGLKEVKPGTDEYLKLCASIRETLSLLAIAPKED